MVGWKDSRNQYIAHKFQEGYTSSEIQKFLSHHGVNIGCRQVRGILHSYHLKRSSQLTLAQLERLLSAVDKELVESGNNIGYRIMWTRILRKHNIQVPRNIVMLALRFLDPDGTAQRQKRRLRRRMYQNQGPNYSIHVDQYDKLRRYGLCIHGAIDGYSRKVLWLKVARTNRNPRVVAAFFLDFIREIHGVPRLVRMDRGTENTVIEDMQKSMRWHHNDDKSGSKSVLLGKSSTNQRIEQWWGTLRKNVIESYMSLMKCMEEEGIFFQDSPEMVECMRFSFMSVLQKDLDNALREWNCHRLRKNRNIEAPCGKPDILYEMPELSGGRNFMFAVSDQDLADMEQFVERPNTNTPEFEELFTEAVDRLHLNRPETLTEAAMFYAQLVDELNLH